MSAEPNTEAPATTSSSEVPDYPGKLYSNKKHCWTKIGGEGPWAVALAKNPNDPKVKECLEKFAAAHKDYKERVEKFKGAYPEAYAARQALEAQKKCKDTKPVKSGSRKGKKRARNGEEVSGQLFGDDEKREIEGLLLTVWNAHKENDKLFRANIQKIGKLMDGQRVEVLDLSTGDDAIPALADTSAAVSEDEAAATTVISTAGEVAA